MGSTRLLVCVDIDNTIADTDHVLRRLIQEVTLGRVKLSHSDVTHYEYWRCPDPEGQRLAKDEWHRVLSRFNSEGISEVEPFHEVVPSFNRLRDVYEIHLVTSRDPSTKDATTTWLRNWGIPYEGLHFARHREKHQIQFSFASAVDDDLEQAVAFSRIGVPAIVLSQPWNQTTEAAAVSRLPNWAAISSRLLSLLDKPGETVSPPPDSRYIPGQESQRS